MPDENALERELADIEATLRDLDPDELELTEPPASVWDGIAAAIGEDAVATGTSGTSGTTGTTGDASADASAGADELAARRRRRTVFQRSAMLVAAAAVLIVAGVLAFTIGGDDTEIVATADLTYDPDAYDPLGADAAASVKLVEVDDGDYAVEFDEAMLPSPEENADLELWLLQIDDGGVVDLVSLGKVDETDRRYTVPAGYDPAVFHDVDISVEPRDGDESHSGRTILRGPFST